MIHDRDAGASKRHGSKLHGALGLALSLFTAGCNGIVPLPAPKPGSWAVFLCQASDAPAEPRALTYYQEMFDGNADHLPAYFTNVSNGAVDVSGTAAECYGWFKMGVATADIAPNVRNNWKPVKRDQTAQDCRAAGAASLLASGRSIDLGKYKGVITVINVPVDAGAAGDNVVANANEPLSFYAHEMLHVYGLDHSMRMATDLSPDHAWNLGADRPYEDCWDIMSYRVCTYEFMTAKFDGMGPELQMAYRQKLKWADTTRLTTIDAASPAPSTVTLAPVSEPTRSGSLMAQIVIPTQGSYTVEYRVKTGFDRGIPSGAVVIRELRKDGITYLPTRQNGKIGWGNGETFTDSGNFLSITVTAMAPTSATITVNPRYVTTAAAGEICGNKYVGEVRTCPAGTTCSQRKNGQLVSIDYFCD